MKAARFERRGPAREVLDVGKAAEPEPGPGEVRVRIAVRRGPGWREIAQAHEAVEGGKGIGKVAVEIATL